MQDGKSAKVGAEREGDKVCCGFGLLFSVSRGEAGAARVSFLTAKSRLFRLSAPFAFSLSLRVLRSRRHCGPGMPVNSEPNGGQQPRQFLHIFSRNFFLTR